MRRRHRWSKPYGPFRVQHCPKCDLWRRADEAKPGSFIGLYTATGIIWTGRIMPRCDEVGR